MFVLFHLHRNTSSLTIVLESHPLYTISYNDINYYSISRIGRYIGFAKENESHRNPSLSIFFTLGEKTKRVLDVTVEFNSVNIIGNNQLFDISRRHSHLHNGDIKVRLIIQKAVIRNGRNLHSYVNFFNIGFVEIFISRCWFVGTTPRRWFKLHSSNRSPLNITIENSGLHGNVAVQMVGGIAHFRGTLFRNVTVPNGGSLLEFRDSTVAIIYCRFLNISSSQLSDPNYRGLSENYDTRFMAFSKQNAYVFTAVSYTHLTLPTICSV